MEQAARKQSEGEDMRTVEVRICTFDELSAKAKEKAREWYRESDNDFSSEVEYESYETATKLLGINLTEEKPGKRAGTWYTANTIQWSGFWSQGDGASFTGTYCPKHSSTDVRKEFPADTKLHQIADALTAFHCRYILNNGSRDWSAKITHSGREVHKYSMGAEVYDAEGEELNATLCDEFLEIMRDFAQWIYDGLEEDYNSLQEDEYVDECIRGNDYEFTEEGEAA